MAHSFHVHTALCSHTLAARIADTRQAKRVRRNREAVQAARRVALHELTLII